jgi:uncharacterized protein with beta-barrel porin domain
MFSAALLPGALPGSGVGFTVSGAAPPSSVALASAGSELRLANNWSLLAKFDGELARGWRSYTGNAKVRYSW